MAVQLSESMGAPAFLAHAQCEYGGLLVALPHRQDEGRQLLERAETSALALGFSRLARRARTFAASN